VESDVFISPKKIALLISFCGFRHQCFAVPNSHLLANLVYPAKRYFPGIHPNVTFLGEITKKYNKKQLFRQDDETNERCNLAGQYP